MQRYGTDPMFNNITIYNGIILCERAATGAVTIVADRRRKCDCCCRSRVVGLAWRLRPDCSCWSRASSAKHGGILAGKTRRARAYARRRRLDTAVDGPRRRTHASPAAAAWPRAPPTDADHSWCAGGGCGGKYGARRFRGGRIPYNLPAAAASCVRRRRIFLFFFAGGGGRPLTRIIVTIIISLSSLSSSTAVVIVILFAGAPEFYITSGRATDWDRNGRAQVKV